MTVLTLLKFRLLSLLPFGMEKLQFATEITQDVVDGLIDDL